MDFSNKVVLITGAAQGMGASEARIMAQKGASVVIADFADEAGKQTAEEICAEGGKAIFVHLDVTKEDDWENAKTTVINTFGKLHVLVNNAGINQGHILQAEDLDTWNRVFAINVTGPMLGIRTFCELMKESGGGSIINIASTVATNGHFLAAYSSSKWALRGLSKSAAFALGPWGIRSNVVCPGFTRTRLTANNPAMEMGAKNGTALGRMGSPEEVAAAVLFLASDEAAYITGQEISVDGGFDATAAYGTGVRASGFFQKLLEDSAQ